MEPTPQKPVWVGIVYIFCSVFFFSGVDICSKAIVAYTHPVFTNIIRYILLIMAILLVMGHENRKTTLHLRNRKELFLRGFFQGGTGLFYLFAVQTLPLSLTSALYFTAPLFVVALSPFLLKEKVTLRQWIAVLLGLSGMLIILRPGGEISLIGLFWIMLAMICSVFLQIYTRRLSFKVNNWHQLFYGNVGALILGLFALPLLPSLPESLPLNFFLVLGAMIFFTVFGQIFLVKAFSATPASVLAPFNYFQLVFVLLLSFLIFEEKLDTFSFLGVFIIILAGISSSLKKKK